MTREIIIDIENFKKGFYDLLDSSKAPVGSLRIMKNCQVTNRGGLAPRPGTVLLGTNNSSSHSIRGFYTFRKSFGENEFLIKCYDDEIEVFSNNLSTAGWFRLKDGFTADKEFGFVTSLVNTDNQDYVVFNNRYEEYQRWAGSITQLNGALTGAETSVTVDSTITDEIFESQTATASAATSLTITDSTWADSQWVGFVVLITSGVLSGQVRRITSNNGTQITFETLGSDPGLCSFEVRQLAFPLTRLTGTGIAFLNSNPDTITDTGSGFLTAGFKAGDRIIASGTASNNKTFTIDSVVAGTITLVSGDFVVAEGAGASMTIALAEMGIIYNGTAIQYTNIPSSTVFTVASAHAGADNLPVVVIPNIYPQNPRGNRLTNYLNRIMVGDVRSALARNAGGALQGFSSGGSTFVSKVNNPFDFRFSAARVAGEGDIIGMPYGGGEITDIQHQEDSAYVFKEEYIEQIQYSQDANDLAVRTPLKTGVGSVGKTIKGSDDVYFITKDKNFTSIGRVKTKDIKPETLNIGLPIQNFLNNCGVDDVGRGHEIEDKVYIPLKSSDSEDNNDIILIYNKANKGYFEGIWDLPAFGISDMGGNHYYAESNTANVYQMLTDEKADVVGENRYPIISEAATHFMNLTASKSNLQATWGLFVEGYIRPGSSVTYNMFKDFETTPFFTLTFVVDDETGLLDGQESSAFLGSDALALHPLGASFSDVLEDGRRHFSFRQYFPYKYGNYFSVGYVSDQVDNDVETIRFGLMIREEPAVNMGKIRNI
jgi:hypothetical protein